MKKNNFLLDKWFLDFVGNNGEAMIIYIAKLTWHGTTVHYTCHVHYNLQEGIKIRSRFRNTQPPIVKDGLITWSDEKFGIDGRWRFNGNPLKSRLIDSEEGQLNWYCLQPASNVLLRIKNKVLEGRGYAEQLILTIPPWNIPMHELRWGHFGSNEYQLVWIEIRENSKKQWLWLNGEEMNNCIIEDDHIEIPEKNYLIKLNQEVVMESGKKIYSVVEKLVEYVPGFKKIMPLQFLMANNSKWLSNGQFQKNGKTITNGIAIHECVNFNATDT